MTTILAMLLLAAAPPVEPVSKEPLWFRIELGAGTTRIVSGFLDESKGTGKGYDRAVVDTDGDGTPETIQKGEFSIDYGDGRVKEFEVPEIRVTHEGARWTLEFLDIAEERPISRDGVARTRFCWTVEGEEAFAMFFDGQITLYDRVERARGKDPVRLGPPFRWKVSSGQRGPHALLNVAVKDAAGLTLHIAGRGEKEARPRVRISKGDGVALILEGEYG